MTPDIWKFTGGVTVVLAAIGGIVHAIARSYFNRLEMHLAKFSEVAADVEAHNIKIMELERRITEFSTRLATVEGSLTSQMRSIESQVSLVNVNIANLTGQLKVFDRIRGLVGKRDEDKE